MRGPSGARWAGHPDRPASLGVVAQLTNAMTHREIATHLREEVCNTARKETGRLVTEDDPALFGAVRGVMCDLDYVAALYYGWSGKRRDHISRKAKSIRFIRDVMSAATGNDGYREFAAHLYDLYRCGVVHLRAPKFLASPNASTKTLTWALMYERKDQLQINSRQHELEHLKLLKASAKLAYLPLSIKALLDDFLVTDEHVAQEIEAEGNAGGTELRDRWRSTADALAVAEPSKLSW